jgi:hypothetical protein
VRGYPDELEASSGKAAVRFVQAISGSYGGVNVTWGTGSPSGSPLFSNLDFGAVPTSSPAGTVSSAGYLAVDPGSKLVEARGEDSSFQSFVADGSIDIASGSIRSAFLAGEPASGFQPPQIVLCKDVADVATTGQPLGDCAPAQ